MTRTAAAHESSLLRLADDAASSEYVRLSSRPLHSLALVLPLLVVYEVGTQTLTLTPDGFPQHIVAFSLMRDFFALFGATGQHLPALAVVGILLTWHIARGDPWRVKPGVVAMMAVEAASLALPLLVLGSLVARYVPMAAGFSDMGGWAGSVVLSIGAGVYEELVFRLIAFAALSLVLHDLMKLPQAWSAAGIVIGSALLFAAYHYLGSESFSWWTFGFRTLAGVYFGAMFLARGFGVTAFSHAAYDIFLVTLRAAWV